MEMMCINDLVVPLGNYFTVMYVAAEIETSGSYTLAFVPEWDNAMRNSMIDFLECTLVEESTLLSKAASEFYPLIIQTNKDIVFAAECMSEGFQKVSPDELNTKIQKYIKFCRAIHNLETFCNGGTTTNWSIIERIKIDDFIEKYDDESEANINAKVMAMTKEFYREMHIKD